MTDYHNWEPLSEIAEIPDIDATYRQLQQWEHKRETNNFPLEKQTLGRFKFYDVDEVKQWVYLWKKATKRMGRGTELNSA